MADEIKNCDKCKAPIVNGKCVCGFWYEKGEEPNIAKILERAILAYDYLSERHDDDTPLTGDHHTGNCLVIFKGDHADCMKVKKFLMELRIKKMKAQGAEEVE